MPVPGPYRLLSLEVSMITGDETEPSLEQRSVTGASGIKTKRFSVIIYLFRASKTFEFWRQKLFILSERNIPNFARNCQ